MEYILNWIKESNFVILFILLGIQITVYKVHIKYLKTFYHKILSV